MKEKRFSWKALVITALLAAALTAGGLVLAAWLRLGPGGVAVLQGMSLIEHRFAGEAEEAQLADDALRGMTYGLGDRWSVYLSAEEYAQASRLLDNHYVGVGMTYRPSEDGTELLVVSVISGSPADRAGLLAGERVVAVDGQSITEANRSDLLAPVQEPGGSITFTVLDGSGRSRELTIEAQEVDMPSVEYELLEGGVGYVTIYNFYANSAQQAIDAVDDLAAQGARGLLFDVRGNPGGYVSELTLLLDHLLPKGPVFAERSSAGEEKVVWSDEECVELPMVVLADADSYSAAELFAAQLRESVAAPIVGARTCGKGYYQQTFPLANGGGLNLSTGTYTTGGGVSLVDSGVTPDIVEDDPERQMELALECIQGKLR